MQADLRLPVPDGPQAPTGDNPKSRTGFKIEPRQLPARESPAGIVSRPISEASDRPRTVLYGLPPQHHRAHRLRSALVPAITIAAMAAMLIGLASLLNTKPGGSRGQPRPEAETSKATPIFPDDHPGTTSDPAAPPDGPVPRLEPTETPLAPLVTPQEKGNQALETLEAFLKATSLQDRLPMMETKTPPGELASSCLAGKLPTASIVTQLQECNDHEKVTDCYYSVTFDREDGTPVTQKVLVRIRGDASPVVVVDPFLDLYGGRLKQFVTHPDRDSGTFQVVVSARRFCAAQVPKPEAEFTLKLLMDDSDPDAIYEAVCARRSPIGLMLDDPSSGLRWGQAKACTVVLEWDRSDPANPFVRALNIARTDWNP